MELSLSRNYWTFKSKSDVIAPFEYVRTLSNGIVIGKCYDDQEYGLTQIEILEYIKANHIEEIIE